MSFDQEGMCSSWHRLWRLVPQVAAVQAARSLFIIRLGMVEDSAAWMPLGMTAAATICPR